MSRFAADRDYDYFDLGDESDQERAESSEDEIDIILHGTPEQKRRLHHSHQREQGERAAKLPGQTKIQNSKRDPESNEDEFERMMNAELEKTVHMLEHSRADKNEKGNSLPPENSKASNSEKKQGNSSVTETNQKSFYSGVYFDSDDEDNFEVEGKTRTPKHHEQPSNDDLLYDPDMDDEDQKWVDRQRQQHYDAEGQATGNRKRGGRNKANSGPKSDAVLDCPACMTTLCLDCQRHEIYQTQYRAMFVMNCKVNTAELLSVPEKTQRKKFKKLKQSEKKAGECSGPNTERTENDNPKDKFHPVLCEECDTVVGVIDTDEVYHFFNVLVSQP